MDEQKKGFIPGYFDGVHYFTLLEVSQEAVTALSALCWMPIRKLLLDMRKMCSNMCTMASQGIRFVICFWKMRWI